ncbi:MAG: ethanolamine ammonia-lyase subunit EutC [Eubacteriales bacterium]
MQVMDKEVIEQIVREVLSQLGQSETGSVFQPEIDLIVPQGSDKLAEDQLIDITDTTQKQKINIENPQDFEALTRMKEKTSARIGVGRSGPRLKTRTMLTLRVDHAVARDAVFMDVDKELLDRMGLFSIQTRCSDKNEHLTRPDLGEQFSQQALDKILTNCKKNPTVQIYISDGLSSKAIEANVENILPAITEGLEGYNVNVGTPFFVKYGRVHAMDVISETLGSEITCVLIGERPGLATAESMSAYIAYKSKVGMPEARRTVVSNIHSGGISAVEAGAYIADIIKKMLELKISGVDLKL